MLYLVIMLGKNYGTQVGGLNQYTFESDDD